MIQPAEPPRPPPASFLGLLPEAEWASLRGRMDRRSYAAGDLLIARGTPEPEFHVITDGIVSIVAAGPRGEPREVSTLAAGDALGDMSLLTGEPASADAVARTPVTTFSMPQERVAGLGEMRSRIMEALATLLAQRLRHANERLAARYAAGVHAIACEPADLPALARLPHEVARVVDAPVLAIVPAGEAGAPAVRAAPRVTVRACDDAAEIAETLRHAAFEFDQVVVFADAATIAQLDTGLASNTRALRQGTEPGPSVADEVIALSTMPWTRPSLRALSDAFQRNVIGVIPPEPRDPRPRDPVAKLARVLTRRQVGLALGAGAAKGLAHIGALRAIDEMGVTVDVIAGTSIGAAVAAGWAAGYNPRELNEVVSRIARRAVRPTLPIHSFLSSRGIRDELEAVGRDRKFEDLDIPLAMCAADIDRRQEVTFSTGIVWPRILASMAIPGIYPALKAGATYVVDGGVLNPIPARQCRMLGAGLVIAVRLTGKRRDTASAQEAPTSRPLAPDTILRSMEIMYNRLSELSRNESDLTIEIAVEHGGLRDFSRGEETIEEGYRATIAAFHEVRALLPYAEEPA